MKVVPILPLLVDLVALLSLNSVLAINSVYEIKGESAKRAKINTRSLAQCVARGQHKCAVNGVYYYRSDRSDIATSFLRQCLILVPLSDMRRNFESLGTAKVNASLVGNALSFSEDGPKDFLPSGKYLQFSNSATNYVKYSVPSSFITECQTNGVIITFWVSLRNVQRNMAILDFPSGLHIWGYPVPRLYLYNYAGGSFYYIEQLFINSYWQHLAVVMKTSTNTVDVRVNGTSRGIQVSVLTISWNAYCHISKF